MVKRFMILACALAIVGGCATVDIAKTAKVSYPATNASDVEILETKPARAYVEIGTVSASCWSPSDTAGMHKEIQSKAAALGANAVLLLGSGMTPDGWGFGGVSQWATGTAIRYQ